MRYEEIAVEDSPIDHPPHSRVIAAIDDDGAIVAVVGVFTAVHLDPLWIREDHRQSPSILRRLWVATKRILAADGIRAVIGTSNTEIVDRLCAWAGGRAVPGRLYVIPTEES
jgi:hypothetical protein